MVSTKCHFPPGCVFGFPLSVLPETPTEMSATWDLPVFPMSSKPENRWETPYIVSSADTSWKQLYVQFNQKSVQLYLCYFSIVFYASWVGYFVKGTAKGVTWAHFTDHWALPPVVCLGQTAASHPGDELAITSPWTSDGGSQAFS